jgi:hypothetical protein
LLVAGAFPRRKHLKGPPNGFALALPSNSKTLLERVFKGQPYILLGLIISDEGKKFYNIDTRAVLTAPPVLDACKVIKKCTINFGINFTDK